MRTPVLAQVGGLCCHVVFVDMMIDETMVEVNLGERVVMMRMDRPLQDFVDTGK